MTPNTNDGMAQGTAKDPAPHVDSASAIRVTGLCKHFGSVRANDGIDLEIAAGSVHAIIGENGAGKSTLMNMLYGFYRPDSGDIYLDGVAQHFDSPRAAHAAGIGMVHQHFMLVETFTVLENVMLGFEGGPLLAHQSSSAKARLSELEASYGLNVPIDSLVRDLPVGLQQRVEILKTLYRGASVLILDEPTGVLTPQEAEQLFTIIETLKAQGKTIVFISHKLGEVMRIADHATIMRQGRIVADRDIGKTSETELAELMVGRKVMREAARESVGEGDNTAAPVLSLDGVTLEDAKIGQVLGNICLEVKAGEIVGIAGVAGNGQGELLEVITGMRPPTAGTIEMKGEVVAAPGRHTNPRALRRMGLGHVAADRLKAGAVSAMTARENAILGYHDNDAFEQHGIQNRAAITADCVEIMQIHDVRPPMPDYLFGKFSGGNQQKLAIGREMRHAPDLLVVGEPTRGVDIGAVTRIHDQLIEMRNAGKALLVVSSDLDELLAVSDRILVMFEGRIVGEVAVEDADEATLGLMMAGSTNPVGTPDRLPPEAQDGR